MTKETFKKLISMETIHELSFPLGLNEDQTGLFIQMYTKKIKEIYQSGLTDSNN